MKTLIALSLSLFASIALADEAQQRPFDAAVPAKISAILQEEINTFRNGLAMALVREDRLKEENAKLRDDLAKSQARVQELEKAAASNPQ